jgi:multiple sugar transport system ATP-binding protein
MASIDIAAIRKSYGALPILHGIDLTIRDGEFIVLVGPSGCGKSTLLRMIAGLEDISAGEIRIDGRRVNDLPPRDRDIAMVFQSYALYPHMTVAENMSYSLRLRKVAREKIGTAIAGAAHILGLDSLMARRPKALSGGQRQRVAMGRAIVRSPKAFLFDEPLSNLDARLRESMRGEIKKLHHSLGATSIYVTHDQIEAMTLADRIVAMNCGIVQQVGTPLDLYDRPANLFVAGFIGSPAMNMIGGWYRRDAAATWIDLPEGARLALTVPVQHQDGTPAADGTEVTIGIRPEHIVIQDVAGSLAGVVELVEPTGFGTILHLRVCGTSLKAFTLDRGNVALGDRLDVYLPADKLHVFAAEDGRRLV